MGDLGVWERKEGSLTVVLAIVGAPCLLSFRLPAGTIYPLVPSHFGTGLLTLRPLSLGMSLPKHLSWACGCQFSGHSDSRGVTVDGLC
jgi:hypothetical protein